MKPFRLVLLTALAARDLHGYGLYQQMTADGQGYLTVRDWAVYRELALVVKKGLAEPISGTQPRRYHLTQFGHRLLRSEQAHALHTYQLLQQRL